MLTSKLTLKQLRKARQHYLFTKKLENAFIALPATKTDEARKFFNNLKRLWNEADSTIISWFTTNVEPAIKDAFEYFLTKLES